ncbi:dihydrolipoyl dehydrogenase family protein [Streptomyces sp. NPDC001380]|uniref:dihydrolipoyl dehydrogenase family protein n=1 Tax=Streptomyces sp. NPDC001380 TaxID=3364566 RepID=UPI0036BB9F60
MAVTDRLPQQPLQVDAVVVGMGPGGEEVAGRLADAGLDVVGVDERLVGGECPYWGCIPSKIMVRAAGLVAEAHRIPGTVGTAMVHPDWRPVARRLRAVTDEWDDKAAVDRFTTRGGRFVRGRGVLTAPGEVTVETPDGAEVVLRPRRAVVLAVGSEPAVPPVPGLSAVPYWTNRDVVEADRPPASLLVLGGGAVGLELGQALQRLGTAVTVVEAAPRLLGREEPEAGELLVRALTGDGLEVHTGTALTSVAYDGDRVTACCVRGERLAAERLLVSAGRRVDLARFGAGVLGVDDTAPALPVDARMRVLAPGVPGASGPRGPGPGVWAVGDVTGHGAFTHMAVYQADVAVRAILGRGGPRAEYHAVPRVTFTDPEVGAVGLTEAQARERGTAVRVGRADTAATDRGLTHGPGADGFVKLVADADAGTLAGGTVAGPYASEMLGALSVAVAARVPLAELRQTVWAFPTFHRAIGDALRQLA